jgi:hypothetical protein
MKRKTAGEKSEGSWLRLPGRRLDNRGEMQGGCIFVILLFVAAGYVGYLFAVPSFQYSNFESRISEMMPYYRNHDAEYIREAIQGIAAKDFDLKLKDEEVKVEVNRTKNRLVIDIKYSKVVNLPFYAHTVTFEPHLTGVTY